MSLTPNGVPLGLATQQYSTRETGKIAIKAAKKQNRPIEEKESYRWLTTVRESLAVVPQGVNPIIICDREGDFYELYSKMLSLDTSFVVRITKKRNTINKICVTQEIRQTPSCGKNGSRTLRCNYCKI